LCHINAKSGFKCNRVFYKRVLDIPVAEDLEPVRSKKPPRLPVVMSQNEVNQALSHMSGVTKLMAQLMYGGGL